MTGDWTGTEDGLEDMPAIKRIPLSVCLWMDRCVERMPTIVKKAVCGGYNLISMGHCLFCASVPFVYVYQREMASAGHSILSTIE
ncbi:hypothetical protein CWI42_030140 [Ordospora colligata]|uniref:Uncharacterized protein n=1 Tax=Ordospora colligata OC4 TaxID=1354746 RepID=A0A0B2UGE2_9MICR|nr:uncharacterized protein M896_031330 [Ordospora colligata OC4]KHN70146.1 hypothetical protein M896_031330 [Ordospora colligata OC4]TBU16528.1 hypothetical protein CWI41_031290 [Ordospora colligata]TBU16569.1 hypothetical protein CWI40_030210 [Ordospora colligata]TBU19142.1 hypothetical protein CWI42_030140 [Ordospora colligata]